MINLIIGMLSFVMQRGGGVGEVVGDVKQVAGLVVSLIVVGIPVGLGLLALIVSAIIGVHNYHRAKMDQTTNAAWEGVKWFLVSLVGFFAAGAIAFMFLNEYVFDGNYFELLRHAYDSIVR